MVKACIKSINDPKSVSKTLAQESNQIYIYCLPLQGDKKINNDLYRFCSIGKPGCEAIKGEQHCRPDETLFPAT